MKQYQNYGNNDMQQKPIIPNGYKISNDNIVKYRIVNKNHIESYLLENAMYLYLLVEISNIPESKIQKYDIKNLSIGNKEYRYFISRQNYEESMRELCTELTTLMGFDAVAGMQDLKAQLVQDVIYPLTQKDKFEKFKLTIPNGILLYGPPGCGKTFIVRKLAEELNFSYFEVKHSDITTSYIHGGVGKIAEVFRNAKIHAPAIVFFDELEGMVPDRSSLDGTQSYKLEEVNEFLTHLNDAGKNGILVVGATNQPELIDKAILRSGRLDKKIYVMPPDFDARKHLFKMYLSGRPIEEIDYDTLAGQTVNYSCADIEFICNESARVAAVNNMESINQSLIINVIENNPSSIM